MYRCLAAIAKSALHYLFYCNCLKSIMLYDCLFLLFLLLLCRSFFGISGNLEQKNILKTIKHRIQFSICSYRRKFFWSSLLLNILWSEGEFPRDYLINVATCLFHIIKKDSSGPKLVWRTNNHCCNILLSTSFCFLQLNQQKRVRMLANNNAFILIMVSLHIISKL